MAHSEKLFSTAFRGFDREEVIAYMEELNRSHVSEKRQNEAQIAELREKLDSQKKAFEENELLKKALTESEQNIASLKQEVDRLTNDTENSRLAIEAQTEATLAAEAEAARLKTELEAASLRAAALEENAKEYDSMLADVNGILASARRKAEELIEEATKKADTMLESAKQRAKAEASEILERSDEKLAENMKKVKYLYRRQDELAEIFKEHKSKVDSFFAALDSDKGSHS